MQSRGQTAWIIAGAVLGGLIVGPFRLEPGWLWGMVGGAFGGALGAAAAFLAGRPWHPALRAVAAFAVFVGGFLGLWLLTSFRSLLEWVEATLPR